MRPFQINDLVLCLATGPIGTNTYLLRTEPVIVIDPGYGIGSIVKSSCVVFLTHGHFDHVCGLKELNVEKVYVSKEDSMYLKDPSLNLSIHFGERFTFEGFVEILTNDTLSECGVDFQVIYAPGHTPGSILLRTNGVIFSGDTIFLDSIGRTDLPGGDEVAMSKTLNRLRKILRSFPTDLLILPGHGEFGKVGDILKYNDFLKEEER